MPNVAALLDTSDIDILSVLRLVGPGAFNAEVEFLQKRMDENPQYQGLVAFTNLHDPGAAPPWGENSAAILRVSVKSWIKRP